MSVLYLGVLVTVILLGGLAFLHRSFRAQPHDDTRNPSDVGLTYEDLTLHTVADKRLAAWWVPADEPRGNVVIMHGWSSGKAQMLPLAEAFHALQLNLLMIDARNHGESDRHTFSSMPRFAEDLRAGINWLNERPVQNKLPLVVAGHSVGAGAVLLEASRSTDIDAVVSLSPFSHPEVMMRRYLGQWCLPGFLVQGILNYVQWLIGNSFDDIAPVNTVKRVMQPVLIVHGSDDQTVPVGEARAVYEASDGIAQWMEIEGADHDLSDGIDASHLARLQTFLKPVLEVSEAR